MIWRYSEVFSMYDIWWRYDDVIDSYKDMLYISVLVCRMHPSPSSWALEVRIKNILLDCSLSEFTEFPVSVNMVYGSQLNSHPYLNWWRKVHVSRNILINCVWIHIRVLLPFLWRDTTSVTSCLLPWIMKPFKNRIFSLSKHIALWGANVALKSALIKRGD